MRRRAGRCYSCNREGCLPPQRPRSPPRPATGATPTSRARRLSGVPGDERRGTSAVDKLPVAPRLGGADRARSAPSSACTPTSARASGTARASASPTSSCTARRRRSRASASTTRTRATRGRTRSRPSVPIEGQPAHVDDGDRHALIVDRDTCKLYELYALQRKGCRLDGRLGRDLEPPLERAAPGGLDVGRRGRPADPARASRAGTATRRPGAISHALRFTVERTRTRYIYPARHHASDSTDPSLPPMGLRVRLKASVDISQAAAARRASSRQAMKTLRDDPRRQRLELVRLGRSEPALVERPAARARQRCTAPTSRWSTPRSCGRSATVNVVPAGAALDADVAAHRRRELLHDREPEPAADRAVLADLVVEVEALERVRQVVGGDARARCRRRRARAGSAVTVTAPPAGVSRSAFSTRFDAICSSRSSSAATQVSSPAARERDAELARGGLVAARPPRARPRRGRPARRAPRTRCGSCAPGRAGRGRAARAGRSRRGSPARPRRRRTRRRRGPRRSRGSRSAASSARG